MSKRKVAIVKTEEELAEEAAGETWFYCLEARHPGAREVIDDARFFEGDPAAACPVCPACGKQVAAVPVPDKGAYPSSLLALADRLL